MKSLNRSLFSRVNIRRMKKRAAWQPFSFVVITKLPWAVVVDATTHERY
ncbi:hypothetical protein [Vibrio ruber]|nr:hypothetical protein [Vibrio ruber]